MIDISSVNCKFSHLKSRRSLIAPYEATGPIHDTVLKGNILRVAGPEQTVE